MLPRIIKTHMRNNRIWIAPLAGMVLALNGCMAYRGENFKDYSDIYERERDAISGPESLVSITVNYSKYANNSISSPSARIQNFYKTSFEKKINELDIFRNAESETAPADWSIMVTIREDEFFSQAGAIIAGATLLAFPAFATLEMRADTTIFDEKGTEMAAFYAEQDVKLVAHIWLLLPWRMGLLSDARRNLARDTMVQVTRFISSEGAPHK